MTGRGVTRPIGVTVLAWLHVGAGSVAAFLIGLDFVRESGRIGFSGLPLEFVVEIAASLFFGVGLGVALLHGRGWSWYVSSFVYLLAAIAGAAWIDPTDSAWEFPVAGALVSLAAYVYLFTNRPREHLGVRAHARWLPLAVQPLLAVGIVVAVGAIAREVTPVETEGNSAAIQSLGHAGAGSDGDLAFLVMHLESGLTNERISAAWALGKSGRADAVPALLQSALEDTDTNVRINAIGSLGTLGGDGVQAALVGLLSESDEEIQTAALRALADSRYAGAYEQAGVLLRAQSERARGNAADALGSMGRREAVPLLLEAAGDASADVRTRAAFALGKLRDPRGVPALIALSKDDSWEVRGNAVQALGMIGDRSGRAVVEALLDDPNSQVRFAAEQALAKF